MKNKDLDIFEEFATDPHLEKEGAKVDFRGYTFLVARMGNPNYLRELTKRVEENETKLEAGNDEADRLSDQIMAGVFADTILLGWEGTVRYKGEDLPYTRETAVKLLIHNDFRRAISKLAEEQKNFKAAQVEAQGNA